eukprot:796272_1
MATTLYILIWIFGLLQTNGYHCGKEPMADDLEECETDCKKHPTCRDHGRPGKVNQNGRMERITQGCTVGGTWKKICGPKNGMTQQQAAFITRNEHQPKYLANCDGLAPGDPNPPLICYYESTVSAALGNKGIPTHCPEETRSAISKEDRRFWGPIPGVKKPSEKWKVRDTDGVTKKIRRFCVDKNYEKDMEAVLAEIDQVQAKEEQERVVKRVRDMLLDRQIEQNRRIINALLLIIAYNQRVAYQWFQIYHQNQQFANHFVPEENLMEYAETHMPVGGPLPLDFKSTQWSELSENEVTELNAGLKLMEEPGVYVTKQRGVYDEREDIAEHALTLQNPPNAEEHPNPVLSSIKANTPGQGVEEHHIAHEEYYNMDELTRDDNDYYSQSNHMVDYHYNDASSMVYRGLVMSLMMNLFL